MKTIEQRLSDIYTENFDIIAEGFPARLNSARSGHIEEFMLSGLPGTDDERFLQSDIRALFDSEREIYFTRPHAPAEFPPVDGMNALILENGFFAGAAVETGEGIVCGSLREALSDPDGALTEAYNSAADNRGDALAALNSAFTQDGAAVYIPAGAKPSEPILIDNRYSSDEIEQLSFGRTLIVVGEGAEADVSLLYRSRGETRFLVDHVTEIVVGRGARLRISEANLMGGGSALLVNSYLRQESESATEAVFACLGRGFTRLGSRTDLAGEHSQADLWGLYMVNREEHCDIEMRINHLVPDCRSRQLIKGLAAGEATGVFTGLVYVAPDAQRTDAGQQNRNIQLDDTARIYTRPQLEIYADDVRCGHGATVGQLDEEAVYYMRSRGVGEREARRMQLEGFAADITGRCTEGGFCELVAGAAKERMDEF